MTEPGTELILAAIAAHSDAIRDDIRRLEKQFTKSLEALTLEVGEYRRVAMELFEHGIEQEVEIQRLKKAVTTLDARITLHGVNGAASPTAD